MRKVNVFMFAEAKNKKKMTRKLTFYVALILVVTFFETTNGQIIISDCKSLQNISSSIAYLSSYFQLLNDINCIGFFFSPIGNSSLPFNGTLDGKGHTISNVTIFSNSSSVGIFGEGNGAIVRNLSIKFIKIVANNSTGVGMLFGKCSNCNISSINASATPSSANLVVGGYQVGGLVGCGITMNMSYCTVSDTFVNLTGSGEGGGLFGGANSVYLYKCFNLGISGCATCPIVMGRSHIGGLVGACSHCSVYQSGVNQGSTIGNNRTGGLFGSFYNSTALIEVYARSSVFVTASANSGGGIAGELGFYAPNYHMIVQNSYSKASVSCGSPSCGGFFGCLGVNQNFSSLSMSSSYALPAISSGGNIIGQDYIVNGVSFNLSFSQVFFISNGLEGSPINGTDSSFPLVLNCSELYHEVTSNLSHSIWGGDSLISEYGYNYGNCTCSLGCPSSCIYQVPNCQNCPLQAPPFDLTQGNISCTQGMWTFTPNLTYMLTSNFDAISGTIVILGNFNNTGEMSLYAGSSVLVEGCFCQSPSANLNLSFIPSKNRTQQVPLVVQDLVTLQGSVTVNIQSQPNQATTNYTLIFFNSTQQSSLSSTQINVVPNYNGSNCDTISSQTINQPNTLGISITTSFGSKCGGGPTSSLGLILGLTIGLLCAAVIVTTLILIALRKKEEESAIKLVKERELKNLRR